MLLISCQTARKLLLKTYKHRNDENNHKFSQYSSLAPMNRLFFIRFVDNVFKLYIRCTAHPSMNSNILKSRAWQMNVASFSWVRSEPAYYFFFVLIFFFAVFALAQTPEHLSNRKIITEFYSVCPNLHRLQFVFLSC